VVLPVLLGLGLQFGHRQPNMSAKKEHVQHVQHVARRVMREICCEIANSLTRESAITYSKIMSLHDFLESTHVTHVAHVSRRFGPYFGHPSGASQDQGIPRMTLNWIEGDGIRPHDFQLEKIVGIPRSKS
jgi:hypothetical protein